MNPAAHPHELIDVDALRVGMFVHLDGGWLSHPFSVSSFRIGSPDEIATIASLGLKQVRWSRRQSVLGDLDSAPAGLGRVSGETQGEDADTTGGVPLDAAPKPVRSSPEQKRKVEQLERWRAEREAQKLCERQFAEAAQACREATSLVLSQPLEAGARTTALTRALVDKMLGRHELCIRLLGETAGEHAAAHAMNVTVISLLMGRVCGLDDSEMLDLGAGALMHDIGKLDLPEAVRHPDTDFSPAETRAYRDHVAHGVAHARRMGLTPAAALVIGQHHEHADGSGFPLGLGTDRQSVPSRIVSLVNRYDNLCNPHRSATAVTPHEALALLFATGRATFDDAILSAFIRMLGVYPPGSTVQLTDDRYALVLAANSTRPLRPRVRIHDPRAGRDDIQVVDLEATPGLGIRRSLKPSQLPTAAVDALAPQPRAVYFFEPARATPRDAEPCMA